MMRKVAVVALVLCAAAVAVSASGRTESRRLIQTSDHSEPKWMEESEILEMIREREASGKPGVGFRDVTERRARISTAPFRKAFPTGPNEQRTADQLISLMSADNLYNFLSSFSSFHNRYYTTETGYESHVWLRDYMQGIADQYGRNDTSCYLFEHDFLQPSVICRVEGSDSVLRDEVVVCSAHSDSINSANPTGGRAPGADDDGSGVADFVEVFRAMMAGSFYPKRTIDFIGYAAEEVGLRGSLDVAQSYADEGVQVYGVYHNEMSGYAGSIGEITILQDYVDRELTNFLQILVPTYTSLNYRTGICGYGCSDHASWTEVGIPAICTAEAGPFGDVNPEMHSADDDIDLFDAEFSLEFAKLALGMVVELAQYDP